MLKDEQGSFEKKFEKLLKAPTNEDFVLIRNRLDQSENNVQGVRKNFGELEKKFKMLK
jgi:hypothetical protein